MANANAHFDPKVLAFLHNTSSATPHRDSGNARALEKSGAIGKLNVAIASREPDNCDRGFLAITFLI